MTEEHALEIIASLGADPARWPDAERRHVLALAGHPPVAAALADARALDALLGAWARADVMAEPFNTEQFLPAPVHHASPRRRRWLGAGALAAAAVAAVVLMPMGDSPAPAPQIAAISPDSPVPSAMASEAGDAAFATVFTPTVDEDELM